MKPTAPWRNKFGAAIGIPAFGDSRTEFFPATELVVAKRLDRLGDGWVMIGIGGYFGPSYSVELEKGRLNYTHWPRRLSCSEQPKPQHEQIQPSARAWQAFRKALDRLNVWAGRRIIRIQGMRWNLM